MGYSKSIVKTVLSKVLPPENRTITSVSKEFGISRETIGKWIKNYKNGIKNNMISVKSPSKLNMKEKYEFVIKASKCTDKQLGKFLRLNGIHSEHINLWQQEIYEMVSKKNIKEKDDLKTSKSTKIP